jgi:hypothetical protein
MVLCKFGERKEPVAGALLFRQQDLDAVKRRRAMQKKIDFFPCICGAKVKSSAYSSRIICVRKGCTRHEELRSLLGCQITGIQKVCHFVESVLNENDLAKQREMIQKGIAVSTSTEVRQYLWNWLHLY